MTAYDRKAGGGHYSDAIHLEVRQAHEARLVAIRQAQLRAEMPEPARCPDTGEPFCTCSAHIPKEG